MTDGLEFAFGEPEGWPQRCAKREQKMTDSGGRGVREFSVNGTDF
jgi:hypothetical protein